MSKHDTVNGTIGRDADIIDNSVDWIAKEFEAGDQGDIDLAACELSTKRRGTIQRDGTGPVVDERTRIEVFYATESRSFQGE